MSFQGKEVLITGASGALGKAVCKAFLDLGANVHASYIRDEELANLSQELAENDQLEMRRLDLTHEWEVQSWFQSIPQLDVLVNVAGGFSMNPVIDTSLESWDHMFEMNLKTAFLCCREGLIRMKETGEGRIINVGAFAAAKRCGGMAAYTTSKAGVLHLTEVMAEETLDSHITVNAILPTIMDTENNRKAMPDEDFSKWVPLSQVASTITFLAHPDNWPITGALIPVRGRC